MIMNANSTCMGNPIVCTSADAFRCFVGTDIGCLAIGNCFLRKEAQDPTLRRDYVDSFEMD